MQHQAKTAPLNLSGSHAHRSHRGPHTRRVFTLLKIELLVELAGLLAGFFSAYLLSTRKPAMGFSTLWHLLDGLMALSLIMLLVEAWLRHRAGRMQKLHRRVLIFAFILLGYLLFQVMTGRLALAR